MVRKLGGLTGALDPERQDGTGTGTHVSVTPKVHHGLRSFFEYHSADDLVLRCDYSCILNPCI